MTTYFLDFLSKQQNDSDSALCIGDNFFSYKELCSRTSNIVGRIKEFGYHQQSIGVYLDDDINTYASILAIWYTGNIYIPLHPTYPPNRIESIVNVANISLILSNTLTIDGVKDNINIIEYPSLAETSDLELNTPVHYSNEDIVYVLFTSGSTGIPKGVQISYLNLLSFLNSVNQLELGLPSGSGYLQMFELTFDLSIVSLLLPFMNNGTLYHVSSKSVKYLEIYRLLEEYPIQFAIIVPSVLSMLKPYFDTISLPTLSVVALSGEAVPLELTMQWQVCCPNARFFNFYGPTECTIFCTYYEIPRTGIQTLNGIVSIGKANRNAKQLCLDEEANHTEVDEKSILWIGGDQVSPGYLNNEQLNNELFVYVDGERYYNTGDIVICNAQGELFYLGRKDYQVKISGYRIELSEVEHHSSKALETKSVVIAVSDNKSMMQLVLFISKIDLPNKLILDKLKNSLPDYMLPSSIIQLDEFPMNDNGKLDRKKLKLIYDAQ